MLKYRFSMSGGIGQKHKICIKAISVYGWLVLPNLIGLLILGKVVVKRVREFEKDDSGEKDRGLKEATE